MNLFNVGPLELLLILIIALFIFGPRRLPEIARGLGKAIREFRQTSQELTEGLARELEAASQEPGKDKESAETPASKST